MRTVADVLEDEGTKFILAKGESRASRAELSRALLNRTGVRISNDSGLTTLFTAHVQHQNGDTPRELMRLDLVQLSDRADYQAKIRTGQLAHKPEHIRIKTVEGQELYARLDEDFRRIEDTLAPVEIVAAPAEDPAEAVHNLEAAIVKATRKFVKEMVALASESSENRALIKKLYEEYKAKKGSESWITKTARIPVTEALSRVTRAMKKDEENEVLAAHVVTAHGTGEPGETPDDVKAMDILSGALHGEMSPHMISVTSPFELGIRQVVGGPVVYRAMHYQGAYEVYQGSREMIRSASVRAIVDFLCGNPPTVVTAKTIKDFPPKKATRVWFPLRSRGALIAQRTGRNWAVKVTYDKDPSRVAFREAVTVLSPRALRDMYRKEGSPGFGSASTPVPTLKSAPVQRMPNEMEFHEYYHYFLKKHRKDIERKWRDTGDFPGAQGQLFDKMKQKRLLEAFIKKHGIPVSHDDNARFREDLWKTLMGRGYYSDPEYRRLLGPPIKLKR